MRQKRYLKPALILVAGFFTIFILNTVARLFVYREVRGIANDDKKLTSIAYDPIFHSFISLIIPILGGIVVGYLIKKNGALYGAILALIVKTISILIISSMFFYPAAFYAIELPIEVRNTIASQNIMRQLYSLPISILFIAWGGWVGEKLSAVSFKHLFTRV